MSIIDQQVARAVAPDRTKDRRHQEVDNLEEELRQSEAKYRRLVENLRREYFFYSHGKDGIFTYLSPSVTDILGYSIDEFLTHYAEYFTDDPINDKAREHTDRSIAGEQQPPYELEVYHKDGGRIRLDVQEVPVLDADGKVMAIEGIAHDITEKRKTEQELLRAQKLEALGMLAGGIAHDFNNLLTVVLSNTSLLRSELGPAGAYSGPFEDIQHACDQAKQLTRQLLTFSRGGKPIKDVCDLRELVRDSVSLTRRGTNAVVKLNIAQDLSHVEADAGQLQQVINNLVINAVQAMPSGGTIRVDCDNVEVGAARSPLEPGPYARVVVKDEGVGIPHDHLARIFDPYFSTKPNGSGLGLSVCHSVTKNHGGHISVESTPGVGSTFEILLPSCLGVVTSKITERSSVEPRCARILVLDDEVLILRSIGRLLRRTGYEVTLVTDGHEAIDRYTRALADGSRFDAVILDLTVPGSIGGLEVVTELRRIDPEVRAVVSSGYSSDPVMSSFREHGFDGVMAKPYTEDDLRAVLDEVLDQADL